VITRDLRNAIAQAAAEVGLDQVKDPGLRPTGTPGQYAASVALTLGAHPSETAAVLAARLGAASWIATAEVTGPGYLTITVTPEALAAVADAVTAAGPACVTSDALAGLTVAAAPPGDPLAAATWEEGRAALAAQLTARLAAAAGATVADPTAPERNRLTPTAHPSSLAPPAQQQTASDGVTRVSRHRCDDPEAEPQASPRPGETNITADRTAEPSLRATIAYAGRDAVTFALARAIPGKPLRIDPEIIARHVLGNPAYAVRYAHARAASGMRWAVNSRGWEAAALPRPPADPGELAVLDALSWLPERVATAARRGRPDEFARYLEDLASVIVDRLSTVSHPGTGGTGRTGGSGRDRRVAPGSDRLALAEAARTGLAAGLGLLGVGAPDRI
jgi:arginyl-tRNA synthetase